MLSYSNQWGQPSPVNLSLATSVITDHHSMLFDHTQCLVRTAQPILRAMTPASCLAQPILRAITPASEQG